MTAKEWFQKAQAEGFAIGAFNIDSLEIFKGVLTAAKNKKSPVIVEFSPGEVGYFGLRNIVDMVVNARDEYQIPILLNLDHGKKVEDCQAAVDQAGFDNVHFDGSSLEFSDNVQSTRKVVAAAHSKGLLVEGEVDKFPGESEVNSEELNLELIKTSYTDPKKAIRFVEETKVDIFAAFFGNVHGTYPTQPDLDIALLTNIREVLPNTFLSLHGGSGISAEQVKRSIQVGKIVKVNVNTELRQVYRDAVEEKLGEEPKEYKVYEYADSVILAVASVVEEKIDVFGSGGKI